MIEVGSGPASGLVGLVAVLVVAWGAWLSAGSSRRGPAWAESVLTAWRWMPWSLAALAAALAVLVSPIWVGVAVLYIAGVTGWLMGAVRRNLGRVKAAYGEFDPPPAGGDGSSRMSTYLLVGAAVLAVLAAWDTSVRGWAGVFGLVLALCLGGVGLVLRRAG